jgi:hypothetical protein
MNVGKTLFGQVMELVTKPPEAAMIKTGFGMLRIS